MPKDSYSPNRPDIEPLEAGQYPDCQLAQIKAFRQRNKDEQTGEEFMRTKLALYWDTGYTLPDSDEPYYVIDGFVTFSFHERSNFGKMLAALGLIKPGEPVEFEYELGDDYAGRTFADLPIYEGGPKKDIEVPVTTLKIDGTEIIGMHADLVIGVKDSGYNKVELVMRSGPKAPSRLGPRRSGDSGKAEAPVNPAILAERKGGKPPLWLTWRTKNAAIKWAATLKNADGSPAYQSREDTETVWQALYITFQQEAFEPNDQEFYWHWHRWHEKALTGEEFSFQDVPSEEDAQYLYQVQ